MQESKNIENEIYSEIFLKDAELDSQRSEVEWTKSRIIKFQEFIKRHKGLLNDYLVERRGLKIEKSRLKGLNFQSGTNSSDSEDDLVPSNKEEYKKSIKSKLFNDSYEILKTSKPETFYRSINDRFCRDNRFQLIYYQNQTFIPNDLKVSTVARKMLLYRIDIIGEYKLNEIIHEPVNMSVDIHIASGIGELLSVRGEEPDTQYHITAISSKMSYFIQNSETVSTNFILMVTTVPMILALDIHDSDDTSDAINSLPIPEAYPSTSVKEYSNSFVKLNLTLNEIQHRVLFIDASFAIDVDDCLVPIALTVINYQGIVLLTTVICPRTRIKNYCQEWHGLSEKDIIGKPDSNEILKNLYSLVYDKIIVGHTLEYKMKSLKIDMKSICGLRDLQGSIALVRAMGPGTEWLQLSALSETLLKQPIQNLTHSAETNAHVIRKVYVTVESFWQDTVTERATVSKRAGTNNLSSVARNSLPDRYVPNDFFGEKRRKI